MIHLHILTRSATIQQANQNMVEAGIILPNECEPFIHQLQQLDPKDLIAVLMESVRILNMTPVAKRINFYYVDIDAISKN